MLDVSGLGRSEQNHDPLRAVNAVYLAESMSVRDNSRSLVYLRDYHVITN